MRLRATVGRTASAVFPCRVFFIAASQQHVVCLVYTPVSRPRLSTAKFISSSGNYGRDISHLWSCTTFQNLLIHTASTLALGPTQPPIQWVPGAFSREERWPGANLTTYFHLVLRSRTVELYLHCPQSSCHSASLSGEKLLPLLVMRKVICIPNHSFLDDASSLTKVTSSVTLIPRDWVPVVNTCVHDKSHSFGLDALWIYPKTNERRRCNVEYFTLQFQNCW
jgi:hypothetical protein